MDKQNLPAVHSDLKYQANLEGSIVKIMEVRKDIEEFTPKFGEVKREERLGG
jgi:hypothetical protein